MLKFLLNLFPIEPPKPNYILMEKPIERYNPWEMKYNPYVLHVIHKWCNLNKKYLFEDSFSLKEVAEARLKYLLELENK